MRRFLLTFILLILVCSSANPYSFTLKKDADTFVQKEEYQTLSDEANIFYAQNNINEAQNIIVSIPEEERSAQNWLLLGNILQDKGKSSDAVFMYQKALQVDNKCYKAHYNIGNIYLQEDKPNMAVEEYIKATKIKPDFPYAYYNLGCAYIKLEKYSKARFALLDAIDLKNNVPEFHYNLAYVYKMMNKEKSAKIYLEFYNKLIENNIQ